MQNKSVSRHKRRKKTNPGSWSLTRSIPWYVPVQPLLTDMLELVQLQPTYTSIQLWRKQWSSSPCWMQRGNITDRRGGGRGMKTTRGDQDRNSSAVLLTHIDAPGVKQKAPRFQAYHKHVGTVTLRGTMKRNEPSSTTSNNNNNSNTGINRAPLCVTVR